MIRLPSSIVAKRLFVEKVTPSAGVLMMDGPGFAEQINISTGLQASELHRNHIKHLEEIANMTDNIHACSLCKVSAHHLSRERPTLGLVITEHEDAETNFMISSLREKYELNAREAEFNIKPIVLPSSATQDQLEDVVNQLNANPDVHGISLQRPLPAHLDPMAAIARICAIKDVDGLHHTNVGLLHSRGCNTIHYPCAAVAVKKILEHLGVNVEDQRVAVVGTSNVAGRPVAEYLLKYGATVTSFGRHAPEDLVLETIAESDVVVTACGQPDRFRGSDFKEGSIVIDFGLKTVELFGHELSLPENEGKQFKLVGDVVLNECIEVCSHVVAPENGTMSVMAAVLMENVMRAYELCLNGEVGNDVLKSTSFLWSTPGPPP